LNSAELAKRQHSTGVISRSREFFQNGLDHTHVVAVVRNEKVDARHDKNRFLSGTFPCPALQLDVSNCTSIAKEHSLVCRNDSFQIEVLCPSSGTHPQSLAETWLSQEAKHLAGEYVWFVDRDEDALVGRLNDL
jgi:hypothetical protein